MGKAVFGQINELLKEGSNTNLAVNGSGTPKIYQYTAPSENDVEIFSLTVAFEDGSAQFGDKFMNQNQLANGVLVEVQIRGIPSELANLKRTRDFAFSSTPGGFELHSASDAIAVMVIQFSPSILLDKGSDFVKVTIRDDLSSLYYGEARIRGEKR